MAEHQVGTVAETEEALTPSYLHIVTDIRRRQSGYQGDGRLHGAAVSPGKGNGCQGVRELPEQSWSSARERTGLSMPSFGLNLNFRVKEAVS